MPWMKVDLRRRSTGRPERVEPGAVDDAAVVAQLALLVDDRDVEPGVVGAVAGRPHDGADLAAAEVELEAAGGRRPRRLRSLTGVGRVRAALRRPGVEAVEQPLLLEVGEREDVAQAAGEERGAVADRRPAPDQVDAEVGERVEVERRALGGADELRRGQPPGAGQVVDLVVPLVPDARRVHPPEHVAAAVGARQPDVLPHRQRDRPARPPDLGRELDAGRGGTDDEHAAVGEPRRGCGSRTASPAAPTSGTPAAKAGTDGRLQAPVASTTDRRGSCPGR